MVEEISYRPPIGKSHHAVFQWRVRCYCEVKITRKEIIQYHYASLNQYISQQDWVTLMDGKPVAEQWDSFERVV